MRRSYISLTAAVLLITLLFSCKADDKVQISGKVSDLHEEDVLLFKGLTLVRKHCWTPCRWTRKVVLSIH